MSTGWIKLHRKIIDWQWFNDCKTFSLFVYLLLSANHEPKKWRDIEVNRGQLVTGLHKLKAHTGISIQSIRTSLERLKSTNEITIKSTSQYSIITICNYNTYQDDDRDDNKQNNKLGNKPVTNDQQTINNKQECKELKEEKKKENNKGFFKPTAQDVTQYANEIGFDLEGSVFIDFYDSNGWKVGKNSMKDWKAAVRTWKQRQTKNKTLSQQEKNNKVIDEIFKD
jgi:hypothetical protein